MAAFPGSVLPLTVSALVAWRLLPLAIPTAISARFLDGDTPADLTSLRPSQLATELQRLGFQPLGVKEEQGPLWSSRVRELSYAHPAIQTFASMTMSMDKLMYYFYTPFLDGGVVLTANMGFVNRNSPTIIVSRPGTQDAAKLLKIHLKIVSDFQARTGERPWNDFSPHGRIEATYHFYPHPMLQSLGRRVGLVCVFLCVVAGVWLYSSIGL